MGRTLKEINQQWKNDMLNNGVWRAIDGYPGYEVNIQGQVRRTDTGRILQHSSEASRWAYSLRDPRGTVRSLQRIDLVRDAFPNASNEQLASFLGTSL